MKNIIEEYLPTKISRYTMYWTLPAATSSYFILDALKPLLNFWQNETITMFQVTVFLIITLLGSLIIIASLLHHVKTRDIEITINRFPEETENNEAINEQQEPSDFAKSIIRHCLETDITTFYSEEIIDLLPHTRIQLETAIEELEVMGIIEVSSYSAMGAEYVLTGPGKKLALTMSVQ